MNAAPCVAQATLLHLNQSPDVVAEVVAESPPAGCLRTLLVTAGDLSGKNAASTAATLAQVQVRKNRISTSQAYLSLRHLVSGSAYLPNHVRIAGLLHLQHPFVAADAGFT